MQFLLNVVYAKREHTTINVLINKLHNKAEELGANLQTPTFKWKYETIKAFFGSSIADKMKYIFWRIDKEKRGKNRFFYAMN